MRIFFSRLALQQVRLRRGWSRHSAFSSACPVQTVHHPGSPRPAFGLAQLQIFQLTAQDCACSDASLPPAGPV
jgi:hypothetical protein